MGFGAGAAGDPEPEQKSRHPVGEDAVKRVGDGLGVAVDEKKNVNAECDREKSENPARERDRAKDEACGPEPAHD